MRARRLTLLQLAALCLCAVPLTAQGDYETTRVAEGVHQFRWERHNGMFVTTPAGVVAFDPIGVDAARRFAREIQRTVPGSPLVAIVYSHSDADHATGAAAMMEEMGQESVPIIAHENAAAPVRERASPDQPAPTVTFRDRMAFEVGGRRIELHYLGKSHTDNLIVPFVPDVGVGFAVDFVANDRMGYQDLPGWYFPDFFDAVSALLTIPFETMVYGHGPPGGRDSVLRQIRYYDELTASVRAAVADGLSEDETVERVRMPEYASWDQYDTWFPMNVRGLYRWVASGG